MVEDLGGPLHQEQFLAHNVHHSAMVLVLCLQYTHGVEWHLYRLPYQKELPLAGEVYVGLGTGQTLLQTYHFLPKLN